MIGVQRFVSARLVSMSLLSLLAACGSRDLSDFTTSSTDDMSGAAGSAGTASAGIGRLTDVTGSGVAGSGVAGSGVAGSGVAGSGVAGSGVVARGIDASGVVSRVIGESSAVVGSGLSVIGASDVGASDQLGYDAVIGCPANRWPAQASLTIIDGDAGDFTASLISGNGLVVGGQLRGAPAIWTPGGGFTVMDALKYKMSALSCDGSVAVTTDSSAGAFRLQVGQPSQQVLAGGIYNIVGPISMTPDGQVVVGNLISDAGDGPHPTRWTAYTGDLPIAGLDNTLVYQVGLSGASFVGLDPLRIFSFNWQETKVTMQYYVPPSGMLYPFILVSPDLSSYTYITDYYQTQITIRGNYNVCPGPRCGPVAISGTGKVVAIVGNTGPEVTAPYRSFLWTKKYGYRDFNTLMAAYGVNAPGTLYVNDMSDDGSAFTGYMDTPTGAPYPQFYAVLPPAAYN